MALHAALVAARRRPSASLWLLIGGGLLCLLIPELVYVRDAFDGGDALPHEHRLQARLPGVAAARDRGLARSPWAGGWLGRARGSAVAWAAVAARRCSRSPPSTRCAGTYARKDGFADAPTLDGLGWLRGVARRATSAAIEWLRDNAPGDAVVLEAVGDDYSAFGHARISTFTGRRP